MSFQSGLASWLVVMSKAPRMGAVKTRLARDIGAVEASRFYRSNTQSLLQRLDDPRWATVIAGAPDAHLNDAGFWPSTLPRVSQGQGDLGDRMGRVMRDMPQGPVVLIGCDIPDVSPAHIAAAFKALGDNDAVFGPAEDGGYWLVGLKRRPHVKEIFGNVRWSSEHALADTMANLEGASIAMLDVMPDIDTGADFARWKASLLGIKHGN